MALSERHSSHSRRRRPFFPMTDDDTGLLLLRTWGAVYAFVLMAFALIVALLTALTLTYS